MTALSFEASGGVLELRGALTYENAKEGYRALEAAMARGAELRVDLFGIDEFDLAGVQVLLMVRRRAAERQIDLVWSGVSSCVEEMLGLLRLEDEIGRPAAVMWGT